MMRSVNTRTSFSSKLFEVNWFLVALIIVVGLVGVVMIFAATDGVWSRGASQHLIRLFVCGLAMLMIALVDVKIWYNLAYPAYGLALVLLIGVELFGVSVMIFRSGAYLVYQDYWGLFFLLLYQWL